MAVGPRLVSLFTLSSLAVLICSLNATPVSAVSLEVNHNARSLHSRGHDALAKRKRSSAKKSKRCKPKAAPAPAPSSSSSKAAPASSPSPSKSSGNKGNSDNNGNSGNSGSHSNSTSNGNSGGGHSSGNIGAGKTGLAWANGDQGIDQWSSIKTMYTWSPACPAGAEKNGIECCPMAWGWNQVDQFQKTVNAKTPSCAMGPNEPEIPSQSNMSPQSAAELWNKYIRPLAAKGVKLVTPACTSDPAGKQWMKDFFAACGGPEKNCGATYYAVHYYDVSADGMIKFLEDLHNTFGMDMWVTEFACQNFNGGPQCSQDEVWAFQNKITTWMNQTPYIAKYFPWGVMHNLQGVNTLNSLMNGDGTINSLGRAYFGL